MFKRDQKVIGMLSQSNPQFTRDTLVFVLDSIQNYLYRVPNDMMEIKRKGAKAACIKHFSKNKGYKYIRRNYQTLHKVIHSSELTLEEKLVALTDIPNIGIVKAGFILQLCIGEVGCIDCHNARLFDINLQQFKFGKSARLNLKLRKAKEYVEAINLVGSLRPRKSGTTPEYLWDNWCVFIADKYPSKFASASDVSRLHVDAIVSVV